MAITERIREIVDRMKWQDQEFAEKLGMSKATLSQRFSKANWSIEEIIKITEVSGFSLYWICEGIGPEKEVDALRSIDEDAIPFASVVQEPDLSKSIEYLKGSVIRPITVVVDRNEKELISYVPIKAQAGYQKGFADSHFMEKLPSFSLPALAKDATYRMFQVDGNSMMQLGGKGLKDGDIVIAQYVDDVITGMRDNRVYVVVSPEGVVIKRCINRLKLMEDPILILTSDNKSGEYPNIVLRPKQIKEVWEAKKVISSDFSFDTNLFDVLGDLQAQTEILKERLDKMEKK